MRLIKLMPQVWWSSNSRNKREISAAAELGFDITVICHDADAVDREAWQVEFLPDQMTDLDYSIPRLKRYGLILRDRMRLVRQLRSLQYDAISCHDLTALWLGYRAGLLKAAPRPALIYDSHEFELGRNAKRSRFQRWCIKRLEGFLIRRCALAIMVNDAIADEVQQIYRLERRPVVVRSIPNRWTVDERVTRTVHAELCQRLHVPEDTFLAMYHGFLMPGRGIETLIRLTALNPNIRLVLLGNGDAAYVETLKRQTARERVEDRILFLDAVPIGELWKFVGAADVGMITIPAVVPSYYYMLPNKFFENIQSETPVICSAFPAVQPLVDEYRIGLTCDPEDMDEINGCVERMRTDKAFYAQCKQNLKRAKEELCWENEKQALLQAYRALAESRKRA